MNQSDCLRPYVTGNLITDRVLTAIYIFILTLNFVANTIMMIGLWKTNRRFTRPQKLYFCLCISDIIVGISNIPHNIISLTKQTKVPCWYVALESFLGFFPVTLSMLMMLSIVIDRYLLVTKPRFYTEYIKNQRIIITIAINSITAFTAAIPHALISYTNHKQVGALVTACAICILILIIVITILNYFLITHVNKVARNASIKTRVQGKYASKVTVLVIVLSIIMIMCYLPPTVASIIVGIYIYRAEVNIVLIYFNAWTIPLMLFNTTINSVVYVGRTPAIKDYFKHYIQQNRGKTTETFVEMNVHHQK